MALDILTGPRARFTLNGVVIALATDWAVDDDLTYEAVKVLNSIEALDHVPTDYNAAMTAARVRLVTQTLVSEGFAPKKGQTPADFLRNILSLPDLTAQLEDTQSGIIIGRLVGVKVATRRISVTARAMSATNLTFVARRFQDVAEIS